MGNSCRHTYDDKVHHDIPLSQPVHITRYELRAGVETYLALMPARRVYAPAFPSISRMSLYRYSDVLRFTCKATPVLP